MATESQRPRGRESAVSLLNAAINAMDLAEKISSITPAKVVFATVGVLLAMIKVCFLLFRDEMFRAHAQPGIND